MLLAQEPLRGIGGGFHAWTGIRDHEVQFGPAERFDATLGVDVFNRHLGAVAHVLAVLGPRPAERRKQTDVDGSLRLSGAQSESEDA